MQTLSTILWIFILPSKPLNSFYEKPQARETIFTVRRKAWFLQLAIKSLRDERAWHEINEFPTALVKLSPICVFVIFILTVIIFWQLGSKH